MYVIEYRNGLYREEVKTYVARTDMEVVMFVVGGSFSEDGRNGGLYDRIIVQKILRTDENDNGKRVPCYIRSNASGFHVLEIPEKEKPEVTRFSEKPEVSNT